MMGAEDLDVLLCCFSVVSIVVGLAIVLYLVITGNHLSFSLHTLHRHVTNFKTMKTVNNTIRILY